MTDDPDHHPTRLPGYHEGPFGRRPELLADRRFWAMHLYPCAQALYRASHAWGRQREFNRRVWERADWPAFTVALAGGHRLHVVYRTIEGDAGVDYLLHHPDWARAELLASVDGHFMGPGLSWPELVAAADNATPGGSTTDPHARLLLLLPAFGDRACPADATDRLAAALRARVGVEDPEPVAAAILEKQGLTGPTGWTTTAGGVRVNDGGHSYRNPANHFALPPEAQARVTAALSP
ncbi:hypothetical protein [Streptomyces sp. 8K308]|uniref:hypothetical protein n=1 Tax=Streptomyces sp. 8K308 TaxID=2530388 RepID=UPI001FB70FA0|nr:hypothetical protein [Streptomyces sp. 8K308]